MAKIDLTSLEWYELTFKSKNKVHGAYKIHVDPPKRHNVATVIVLIITLAGFSLSILVKMATPKQKEVMTEVVISSQSEEPEIKQEEMKRVEPIVPSPPILKSPVKFTAPAIKKDEEVHEDDETKSQEELTQTKVAIFIADAKGDDEANGKDVIGLKQVVTQAEPAEEKISDMVGQMPTSPDRATELMRYIGEHLKYPTIAAENGTQGKVIYRFVVGRGGQVWDVTTVRSLDSYCDKEVIRVIKSMPKWIPGKWNGKVVAVNFIAPIVLKLQ